MPGMPAASMDHPQASPRRRALVLAGDDVLRDALTGWLESVGYEVEDGTGETGLVELVVTDRVYPAWPGQGTIGAIKQRNPGARVVVAGPGPDDLFLSLARSVGADAVLPKPLRRAEFLAAAGWGH